MNVDMRNGRAERIEGAGPWDSLLAQLRASSNATPELIEALRTAHVELELQADELRRSQKAVAAALQTSEAMFEVLPVPLWLVSGAGITVRANAGAKSTFSALGTGVPLRGLLSSADDRTRLNAALESLSNATVASVRGISAGPAGPDGDLLKGDLLIRRVSLDAGQVQAIVAFIDLTRELDREAALDLALAKAHDAALARSDFLSAVSHELRTPLNAIVGFSHMLTMHFRGTAPVEAAKGLHWITVLGDAAKHLTTLVSDLLDQQALDSGRLQIRLVEVALQSTIEEAVEMTQHRFTQHGVRISWDAVEASALVRADPARLKQVLLNLLDNAAKYTPRGRSVHVSVEANAGGFRISVRDEGPGLSVAQQANLFVAFNRLGAERSGIQGLGLGLAVSRQLVQRMGGAIGCDSAPGRGSSFWFWIPASRPSRSDAASQQLGA